MNIWLKIFIIIWLYLSVGVGVVLLSQVIAHKIYKSNEEAYWCIELKLDPDDYEFGVNFTCSVIFWPFLIFVSIFALISISFRKVIRKIWERYDENDKKL